MKIKYNLQPYWMLMLTLTAGLIWAITLPAITQADNPGTTITVTTTSDELNSDSNCSLR